MRIHMMAVGGTGMGALAGLLKAQGHEVTGCDTDLYPPMSEMVERYGISVAPGFDPAHLKPRPDLVIIGNAIHSDNSEARAVVDEGIGYLSMAEAIGRFAVEGRRSLVVTGTHGKTTTTALCGYLLERAGLAPNLIVGGVVKGLESSFLWGGGEWTVLEGDEYETAYFDKGPKFLHYSPSLLIVNNIEMDHLDNFRTLRELETAFVRLFSVVRPEGLVLLGTESPSVRKLAPLAGRRAESFGLTGTEKWTAEEVAFTPKGVRFLLVRAGRRLGPFASPLSGAHNLRNSIAALAACLEAGAPLEALRGALSGFPGVRRRQEVVYDGGGITIVDDFAHHPTAIRETLSALAQRYPARRIVACFEPRSFTCQTRQHQDSLPAAFSQAQAVLLGPMPGPGKIPAQERLDLALVASALRMEGTVAEVMASPEEYLEWFAGGLKEGDLVAFFSSGSFHDLPRRLAAALEGSENGL